MTGPLVALAIPSLASGLLGGWLASELHAEYHLHLGLTPVMATLMAGLGIVAAIVVFGRGAEPPLVGVLERLDRFSAVDRLWASGYRIGLLGVSALAGWIDRYLIDGLMNFTGWAALEGGASARKLQTGLVRDYAMMVVVGVLALVLYGVLR